MAHSVHHLNFIVRDLAAAVPAWERLLGQPVQHRDELKERGVIAARFRLGDTWLVLVQPTRADSVPGKFLEAHGEGFFLLSLGVASLAGEADRLGEAAFSGPVRTGADGWQVRDLDPASSGGVQLQFTVEQPGHGQVVTS
ncbi:MAG: VOC family protein [Gammaproteobacteria bacterium]